MITCKDCPQYQTRNDGTDKGWCKLFNVFARECHAQTQDCRNEMAAQEPEQLEEEVKPAKQPKQVRSVAQLSTFLWKVEGSTGNCYLVDTFNGYLCDCPAGRHNRNCYHVDAVKAKQAERQKHADENAKLHEELTAATQYLGVTVGKTDWLSFSAEIIFNGQRIGHAGHNLMRGYYFSPLRGNPVSAGNFHQAIARFLRR